MDLEELAQKPTVMDDTTRRVGRVYAEAFYSAAAANRQEAEILEELEALEGVLQKEPRFHSYIAGQGTGRDRRKAFLRAFEGRASALLVKFLFVLNEHDRLDALGAVIDAYRTMYEQRSGRVRVAVQSAVPLDEQQQDHLRQKLRTALGAEPVLHMRTDPELLGGLVVQADGWLYDSSVRSRLRDLRKQISEKGSYEIQSRRDRFSSSTGN
jgi:F-type H+-transporting ATPase subunit delta